MKLMEATSSSALVLEYSFSYRTSLVYILHKLGSLSESEREFLLQWYEISLSQKKSSSLFLFPSIFLDSLFLRAGPLNLSAQFERTKANKSHCPFRNFGLFAAFHDLFFRHLFASPHSGFPRSQWFLTSQFDKSGGYTLIPLIWPFSRAQPQGVRDHRE